MRTADKVNRQRGRVANLVGMLRRSRDVVERSVLAHRIRKETARLDAMIGGYTGDLTTVGVAISYTPDDRGGA